MKLNDLVINIIKDNKITKQTQISDILLKKYSKEITQSNISRILKQINAIKIIDENKDSIYQIQDKLVEISIWVKQLIKKIDDNGSVVVIVSHPGSANIIAQALDEKNIKNIMCTIAGDNSVLIIPKDITKIKELRNNIDELFK